MVHDAEHDPDHLLLPDNSLNGLVTRDQESLFNISINKLLLVAAGEQHVTELTHPLVPLPGVSTNPLDSQCEAVRNIFCTVWRMTGAGEQVLAAICLLSVEIGVDVASTDTEGCDKEGNGLLGGAGAAVRVMVMVFFYLNFK